MLLENNMGFRQRVRNAIGLFTETIIHITGELLEIALILGRLNGDDEDD
jgi:hypothetical protein